MYGFYTVLCLGAAVASIDASTCAHFRADGALSCDEFSHGGDIFDSHWNHAGTGEAQANERIQAFFGDDPWLNQSACQSWCLDRNVLVLGDSVDVQLFHAIEHATAAGRASRAGLARTGQPCQHVSVEHENIILFIKNGKKRCNEIYLYGSVWKI